MATTTTKINKPLIPRAKDYSPSPIGYNRGALYSGKALDFDGVNDYLRTPNISTQSTNVWTYSSNIAFSSATAYWFDARESDIGYSVYFNSSIKKLILYTTSGIIFDFEFEFDKWYNIALTSNSTTASLYVNGQLVDSNNYTNSFSVTGDFYIGARHSLSSYLNGQMAGFKAFDVALTAAQVADLYLNPEKIVPDGVADSALKLWLPTMEGVGTTVYDGSGNGNHGTIYGATWVSGIGAPVAQTALVSWNKGTNLLKYSEEFDESSGWSPTAASVTADDTTAPDGQNTADKLVPSATNANHYLTSAFCTIASGAVLVSVFAKKGNTDFLRIRLSGTTQNVRAWFDLENGIVGTIDAGGTATITDVGNGWYKCTAIESGNTTATSSFQAQLFIQESDGQTTWDADGDEYIYIWGASLEQSATAGPYVRTLATAQTSPVLLPQGLTANKDITGVNAFESARNPYSLNLDGKSWGEVHDNASLDYSSEVTLETWIYWTGEDDKGILGRWHGADFKRSLMIYNYTATKVSAFYSSTGSTTSGSLVSSQNLSANNWYHVVFTADGTTNTLYINGVSDNTAAYSSGFYVSNKNLDIGTYQNDQAKAHNGPIALPRIYNRALTATEVARNYNADKSKFGL